jgi:multidrug efflux system outer membrane protein
VRFENGAADFLPVLDAERSLLQIEDQLADTETRTATSLVAVYKAVAGGWPDRMPGSTPLPVLASSTGE